MNEIRRLNNQLNELQEKVRLLSEEKDEWKCKAEASEREKAALRTEIQHLNTELFAYRKGWNSH